MASKILKDRVRPRTEAKFHLNDASWLYASWLMNGWMDG